jgi:hypothetical protein
MSEIKTIKGYISTLKKVDGVIISCLKGYDELPEERKNTLHTLDAEISNFLGELGELPYQQKNK